MRIIENFRVLMRSVLPKSAYRNFSSLTNHLTALFSLGLKNYRALYFTPKTEPGKIEIQSKTFHFRPGTPDADAIIQNIARHEWLQSPIKDAKFILDGGAYIGDTTFAFFLAYPDAKIVCVEPNRDTQTLLHQNLKSLAKETVLINGGLASEKKTVRFSGDYTGASIVNSDNEQGDLVHCIDISSIMSEHTIPFFDIVKLDIEGAEADVLTQNNSWLQKTRRLLVEFHGSEIEKACKAELSRHGFSHFQHRSVHYFDRR